MTNLDAQPPAEQQHSAEDRLEQAVRVAEQALIEFEIAVETFRVEVENFSRLHHQRLGPMYARLDELDALIAEAVAAHSGERDDIERAWEARALVMPMPGVEELFEGLLGSDGVRETEDPQVPRRVRPGDEARRLYRDLVRKAHPDLAQDEADEKRRGEFIARVNEAYAQGDEEALRTLAEEWAAGPPSERAPLSKAEELYARLEWMADPQGVAGGRRRRAGVQRHRPDAQAGHRRPRRPAQRDRRTTPRPGRPARTPVARTAPPRRRVRRYWQPRIRASSQGQKGRPMPFAQLPSVDVSSPAVRRIPARRP